MNSLKIIFATIAIVCCSFFCNINDAKAEGVESAE